MVEPDAVARCVMDAYARQPKKGKPDPTSQWTVLAAVVCIRVRRCAVVEYFVQNQVA